MAAGFAVWIIVFSTAAAMATSPGCAGRLRAELPSFELGTADARGGTTTSGGGCR